MIAGLSEHQTSPLTNAALESKVLVPNLRLKAIADEALRERPSEKSLHDRRVYKHSAFFAGGLWVHFDSLLVKTGRTLRHRSPLRKGPARPLLLYVHKQPAVACDSQAVSDRLLVFADGCGWNSGSRVMLES